jgi:hypothetical protein
MISYFYCINIYLYHDNLMTNKTTSVIENRVEGKGAFVR